MSDNTLHVSLKNVEQYGKLPKIVVMGVGGGGCNAINNMMEKKIDGVEFIAANTDIQSLANSKAEKTIQLGKNTTKGQGAGSYPEIGLASAEEATDDIKEALKDTQLLFITAGMGGGTGTGATPVIAKIAKEMDILTVAVVTKPFQYESENRLRLAEQGISELRKYVDTMIVLPNENLFRIANKETTLQEAFAMSDNVLYLGVRGITDLITTPGLINLDFADVRMVIKKMGRAMMGMGEAEGEDRAIKAVEEALSNPLLEDVNIRGATGALVNITGSPDITLFEFDEAAKRVIEEIGGNNATIKVGTAFMKELGGKIRVSIFATGMKENDCDDDFSNDSYVMNHEIQKKIDEEEIIDGIKTDSINFEEDTKIEDFENKIDNIEKTKQIFEENKKDTRGAFGKTRLTAKSDEDYFDIGSPVVEENFEVEEKKSGFFGLFDMSTKKNNRPTEEKPEPKPDSTYKTKNREIEFKTNTHQDSKNDDLFSIPAYLRKKNVN